ncbi:hypothetical protein TUM20286_03530 [Pseudomonas tohonis]|nr:hypothetical protein TUM20286_03530 [Pseudomonas tohonis]
MTPSDSDEALAIASENCAREPIHIPGSIQPHGFMLVFDEAAGRVLQASENVREWLGLAVEDLLGRHLDELLADVPPLLARLATLADDETNPFHLGDVRFAIGSRAGQPIAMMAHRWDGVLIAEFEPASDVATAYGNFYPLVRSFISRLQESDSIEALCRRAVEEVKRVTGFGRVKAYSFDAEGNGLVLAEEADPGYPR